MKEKRIIIDIRLKGKMGRPIRDQVKHNINSNLRCNINENLSDIIHNNANQLRTWIQVWNNLNIKNEN